jgi:hypothetical protein
MFVSLIENTAWAFPDSKSVIFNSVLPRPGFNPGRRS